MTLPSSGQISTAQIMAEIGLSGQFSSANAYVCSLAGVSTGSQIVIPNSFWGKSWVPAVTCPDASETVNDTSSGGTITWSTTAVATGGAGGYSYSFAYVSGTNFSNTVSGATITFSRTYVRNANTSPTAIWSVTVTDSNGKTATVNFNVSFSASGGS